MRKTSKAGRARIGRHLAVTVPVAAAIFFGIATVSQPFLTPAFAQAFSFSNVVIEGNVQVDPATILSYAGIARGAEVSGADINGAVQRITASGLFETVEIEPQGSTLLIRVKEYPVVNAISIEGNKRLKDERLTALLKSQPRRVYSQTLAEADAAAITEAYRVSGRIAARVEPKIIRRSDNTVDLVFEISEGRVVEVERLSFVGNRAFTDRRLRQVLETKQAGLLRQIIQRDTFVAERLEVDKQVLRDFYLSRGFIDFEVLDGSAEVSRERNASFVVFSIKEGQSYSVGEVSTISEVDGLDAAEYGAVQKIRAGQTYSPALIENNITRMETLALKNGQNFIRVDPRITRNERGQIVDIQFAIVRGERLFVERIDIEGNATTLDQVIRRQFRTVEGDPFNPREIRQAAERIRALGFFSDASVEAEPGSTPDQVVVNVDVEEQSTGSLNFGVTYGVISGPGVAVNFAETNFLGRGQGLNLQAVIGTDSSQNNFSFTEPAFLGRDLSFSVSAFYNSSNQDDARYDTRDIGFSTGIGFPISEQGRLSLSYGLSQNEVLNVDPASSAVLLAEGAQGKQLTSALSYSYQFDNRLTGLNPTGGFLFRFGQDFAGLGGDTKYIRTTVLAVGERKVLKEEVTLRAIFEGGLVNSLSGNTTRVTERFFGNGKIRGFKQNGIGPRDLSTANLDALGGNAFAVARLEADFPIGLPEEYGITAGAFLDVGSVWSLDNTLGGAIDGGFNLRATVGLSVVWTSPLGPLRLNISNAIQKETYDEEQSVDLTIATRF